MIDTKTISTLMLDWCFSGVNIEGNASIITIHATETIHNYVSMTYDLARSGILKCFKIDLQ